MATNGNQEAIDRYLNQIIHAKANVDHNAKDDRVNQKWYDQSNQARAELDKLGYDHNSGWASKSTNYDQAMQGYIMDTQKRQADAMYEQQAGQINANAQNQIAAIERAYANAVAQGQLSEQEAQQQFEENKKAITEMAYRDSQITDLTATDRGIGNSQQLLGLQAGDNARTNSNKVQARTARDGRINEIKTRISAIANQKDIDVANINAQRDNALVSARAGLDSQLLGQQAEFQMGNYQMDRQQQFTQDNMQIQHNYNLETMATQHGFDLSKMSQQQVYALEQMDKQLDHNLIQMKTQHGYDIKKMDKAFDQDLKKMAQQFGYDMSKLSQQQRNAMAQISAQKNAQIEAANREYEIQRERALATLTPGTPEYKIAEGQFEQAMNQAIKQQHQSALWETMNVFMKPGQMGYGEWLSNPNHVLNDAEFYLSDGYSGGFVSKPRSAKQGSGGKSNVTIDWDAPLTKNQANMYFHTP